MNGGREAGSYGNSTLSSAQTFYIKFFAIPFFAVFFTLFVYNLTRQPGMDRADRGYLVFTVAILVIAATSTAISGFYAFRLKKVEIIGGSLKVSNYFREASIPLEMVRGVTEQRFMPLHPVTIHLFGHNEFGSEIVFMPRTRYFAMSFSRHPVVEELRERASSAGGLRGPEGR